MRNGEYDTAIVKKRCETKLDMEFRESGPHDVGWYLLDGRRTSRITIPKGHKPIPPLTYRSMARQLFLQVAQFDDLLACPLTGEAYEYIVRKHEEGYNVH